MAVRVTAILHTVHRRKMKYEYMKKILEFAQIQCQKEIDFLGFGKQGSLGSIARVHLILEKEKTK